MIQDWSGYREMQNAAKAQRRQDAKSDFPAACALAREHGMELLRHTDSHYSLRTAEWTLHLYPGNRRVYGDRGSAKRPPYLGLPADGWTLTQAVQAAIESS